ncbi:type IV secretory system conjugative DNA transfer family protein [Aestuariibacter halophilus]|uniref:Type IV secretory system conjugative DNA transfer family protein n=1 Tax=Fluctibacter halophilus TaxID=226011 RepID=A0ABS8G837_9ALTE|nr:type IV secretory system conjugative DNA transfer family protein [Aestuariibacter halophilus]MCC2616700.1 type IV secretory system conjugative DNA transfer family protein [Aestuariibacter halophilus]
MKSLSTQHQRQVLNNLVWVVFWGVLSIALYNHKDSLHWITYVYLFVGVLMLIKNLKSTWTAYEYGKYQAQLRYQNETPSDIHGNTVYATFEQKKAANLYDPNNGIPIGIDEHGPLFYTPTHALNVAPAGSGKSLVIGGILAHGYRIPDGRGNSQAASMVVTDLKGEHGYMTSKLCAEKHGHKVVFLNPDNLYNLGNTRFNPLQGVIDDISHKPLNKFAVADATEVALLLVPEPSKGDDGNFYFRQGARDQIITAMLFFACSAPSSCIFPELFRVIGNAEQLKETLEEAKKLDVLCGELSTRASDILAATDDHFASFRSGALQALSPFSPSSPLADSVSASDFTFESLKREPTTVYIMARHDRKDVYAPWLGLVTKMAIKALFKVDGNIPVFFCLDEATNMPLPGFAADMTALRGNGFRTRSAFQAKSESRRVNGEEQTETIYSQCDLKQFNSITSYQEAKEISDSIGQTTVKSHSLGEDKTSPWSDLKNSTSESGRPLLMPEELLRLGEDEQIILISKHGLPPIRCKRLPYHHVPEWHAILDDNPLEGGKLPLNPKVSISYREART